MSIIKNILAVSDHPHENLEQDAAERLLVANAALKKIQASRASRILRVLECILQVAGLHLAGVDVGTKFFTRFFQQCIGLILRGEILDGTKERNEDYVRHLGNLHDKVFHLNSTSPEVCLGKVMGRNSADLRRR
ncbi:hypothetical protein YA0016_27495 [Pseudomonas syringae]|uniref:hypothetical protein n=1 Tax=Pseudomonas syringae TaxID=317 RepID=UPI0018E660D7|nr:hypothetical protein [Pseudomonas syringae]MBI6845447.1 hypothetical protein [Pseudomonas syringae]